MSLRSLWILPSLSLGIGLLLTQACSSKDSNPMAPSAPPTGTPGTTAGATIAGTVQLGSAAGGSGSMTAASGMGVTVTGSSLSTTTDAAGRFVLAGVPSGRKQDLHFQGPQVDAHLEVETPGDGQSLSITVHVSGDQALLAGSDDSRREAAVRGRLESIGGALLVVAGRRVITDGGTQFLDRNNAPIGLKDLRVGQTVQVEGASQGDGSVLARKVKLEDDGVPATEPLEVNLRGKIDSVGTSSLQVAGRRVTVDGNTRILDRDNTPIPFSSLKVGDTVEVEGSAQADNSVLATKLKRDDNGVSEIEPLEVRFTGSIQSLGSSSLQVAGRPVTVDGNTQILDRGNMPIPLSSLRVGDTVEVEGTNRPDNSVLAKKIKRDNN